VKCIRDAFVREVGGGAAGVAVWDAIAGDLLQLGRESEHARGQATGIAAGESGRVTGGVPSIVALADGHERTRRDAEQGRNAAGVFYTPPRVVDQVLGRILDSGVPASHVRILDPACGSGRFLVAAIERFGAHRVAVFGVDIDPVAVLLCRCGVYLASGRPLDPALIRERIVCGDFLDPAFAEGWPGLAEPFGAVVGNPPFLSQLRGRTAATREAAARVSERTGGAVRGYADMAGAFLVAACDSARPGGRVSLVLPQSVLVARDAAGVREAVERAGEVESIELLPVGTFADASVHTCVVTARVRPRESNEAVSADPVLAPTVNSSSPKAPPPLPAGCTPPTWGWRVAPQRGIPAIRIGGTGTVGDIAAATADFRDQYYGLRGFILDAADLTGDERADAAAFPRVITSGLIDLGRCLWGERSTRLHGCAWSAPVLDHRRFEREAHASLVRWLHARLVPKVLIATQTRVIEAWPDIDGSCVPVVPVITVTPREAVHMPGDLWALCAAIASPASTAWAMTHYAGAGLNPDAVKLSASQVTQLPLVQRPPDAPNTTGERFVQTLRQACDDPAVAAWWAARAGLEVRRADER